jgi:hypothetical protein
MQQSQGRPVYIIRDTLDRAVVLCRMHARTIASHLIAVHCINLARLSLLYPLLGFTPSSTVLWRMPLYVGNPYTLFDTLFFTQRDLDPRLAIILIADIVVVLCAHPHRRAHFQYAGGHNCAIPNSGNYAALL